MAKRRRTAPRSLAPHPESAQLERRMQRCLSQATAWTGEEFRAVTPEYANRKDVMSGEGSRQSGARYTPRGAFRAIYGSLDMETALAEMLTHHRRQGLPDSEALPLTFVALSINAQRVLDLTRGEIRRQLVVSTKRLTGEPWRTLQNAGQEALTQAIGRIARACGLQGLLVPSAARARGVNLVLFPDVPPPAGVEVRHRERLPARRRSRRS